jgi:hypothetical protein
MDKICNKHGGEKGGWSYTAYRCFTSPDDLCDDKGNKKVNYCGKTTSI